MHILEYPGKNLLRVGAILLLNIAIYFTCILCGIRFGTDSNFFGLMYIASLMITLGSNLVIILGFTKYFEALKSPYIGTDPISTKGNILFAIYFITSIFALISVIWIHTAIELYLCLIALLIVSIFTIDLFVVGYKNLYDRTIKDMDKKIATIAQGKNSKAILENIKSSFAQMEQGTLVAMLWQVEHSEGNDGPLQPYQQGKWVILSKYSKDQFIVVACRNVPDIKIGQFILPERISKAVAVLVGISTFNVNLLEKVAMQFAKHIYGRH